MDINLDLLKTFKVVAEEKNITKASNKLLMTQPAISKAIKNLEEQTNCLLFTRSKKGVILTKEGETLYKTTLKIIEMFEETINELKNNSSINILAGKSISEKILYTYIKELKNKFPNIKISMATSSIEGIQEKLRNKEADIALGYYIDNLSNDFIQEEIIDKLHPIFTCNEQYKDLIDKEINIKELEKYPFILSEKGATTHDLAKEIYKSNNMKLEPIMEVLGTSLITKFTKEGIGISILTKEFISDELKNKELYEIKLKEPLKERAINIQYLRNRTLNKETQYLIELLKNKKN